MNISNRSNIDSAIDTEQYTGIEGIYNTVQMFVVKQLAKQWY